MAKKKSKTQKYKKNVKKKVKKILKNTNALNLTESIVSSNKKDKKENNFPKKEEIFQQSSKKSKEQKQNQSLKTNNKRQKRNEITKNLPKFKKTTSQHAKKNIFNRLLYELKTNTHIIFNALLIITFLIMLIGLIRIEVLSKGTIIYISLILLFLMAIAISYNKYISGKIFTLILSLGMIISIYQMQYTYDFIRNLNSNVYEYKTYYVVTFDNNQNKSIYNINNKKVGLLKDNCINIERKLNTKLDKVNYIEYADINKLFEDFYNQEFRAILVNENQYKYLQNNIQNTKSVKILYEFKVNEKK